MWLLIRRSSSGSLLAAALLVAGAAHPHGAAAQTASDADAGPPPAGVENARRAWQNWTLNCQGCHRPDGSGSAGTTPSVAGTVAKFLSVPQGREYLTRVPGVATSPLSDQDLSEVLNWMLWRFDRADMPTDFLPFTAGEVAQLRKRPLRLEASRMRSDLLAKAGAGATP